MRPIINDPQFNVVVPFSKKVGLVSSTTANMQVTMSKNFFIAGLSQTTLKDDIFPQGKEDENKRDLFNLTPELLFSLYEEPEKMDMYLGQVFPE